MKLNKFLPIPGVLLFLLAGHVFAAPVVNSISPGFGSASDPGFITITGSGFSPGTLVVKFNGVTDATAGAVSATQIQAHVPAGATNGSNPVFVSVNGQSTLSAQDFLVIGAGPYVTGFSPSSGSSSTTVTITGAHFSNPVTVKFNGVNGTGATVLTAGQLTVNPPANVSSGPITVTTTLGSYTTTTNFFAAPAFKSITPFVGRVGTNVLITGTNLSGASIVRFGSTDATSYTVLSNGAIQASVPANAATGQLRVTTPGGTILSGSNFVVQPTLSGLNPNFGPVGTSVTISGANFNVGTPTVKFGNVTAATPTGISFGQLTAVVPANAITAPVTVTTTDGTATSVGLFYLPPRITALSPSNGPPGTLISVTGVNFTDASAFSFNGTPAAGFYVTNNTSLGAVVPVGVTSGPLTITTPGGTTNSQLKFYVPPIINNFNPTHGLPGDLVTISGVNFLDATAVKFNGTNASFTVVNNTTITATVPANAQTGPITVVAPAGTTNSAQDFVLDYTSGLSVVAGDTPDPVFAGSNLVYTITVHNSGPFAAPGVTLTNTLFGTALLASATTSQGTLNTNGNPITGNLGQIPVGGDVAVTLTYVPQVFETITDVVTVASLFTDPAPGNNSVTNTTLVLPLPLLKVTRGVETVRLSWSTALTNYTLEYRPTVASGFWSNVTTAPTIVGSDFRVIESSDQPARFYRLRRLP